MNEVEELVELAMLYDFYGGLLKEHNKEIFEDYILNDLSLAEIASQEGITRQGVYDVVKRCSKQLREYEEELQLVKKFREMKRKLKEVISLLKKSSQEESQLDLLQLIRLTEDIDQSL